MTAPLHPHLAKILAACPSYYNAVADEYVALLDRDYSEHYAMSECFYVECFAALPRTREVAAFIESLSDEPTRGERMLVRCLAKMPSLPADPQPVSADAPWTGRTGAWS